MNDEAAFLSALKKNPKDATVRLVFADWLQDRDDTRKLNGPDAHNELVLATKRETRSRSLWDKRRKCLGASAAGFRA